MLQMHQSLLHGPMAPDRERAVALGALGHMRLQASLSPPNGLLNGNGQHNTHSAGGGATNNALKLNDKSMECQYVATQRGGMALLFEGHRYNKVRDGREGTVYWRCARDRQCPGRAVTVYSRIKKANNKHNHPPDSWRGPGGPQGNGANGANSTMNNTSNNKELTQLAGPEQPLDLKMLSQLGGAGRSNSPEEALTPAAIAHLGHLPTLFTETLKYLASSHGAASANALNSALNPFNLPVFPSMKNKSPPSGSSGPNNISGQHQNGGLPALLSQLRDLRPDDNWWMFNSGTELPCEPLDMAMRSSVSVLKRLRALMKVQPEGISAYIIPHADAHMNEYISSNDARLEFISGFTGSYGTAIVTEEHAALWTDGRYHSQAEKELGQQWTLMKEGLPDTLEPHQWLSKVLPAKGKVGVDSLLISFSKWTQLSRKLGSAGHKLVPVSQNLVDNVWDDRPVPSETPVESLPVILTGRTWQEKLSDVRQDMKEKNAQALIVTALDEIAWLFNLRGSDIEFNPVFFAYAVITLKSAHLFVDENKITIGLEKHLTLSESQSPKSSVDTGCGNGSLESQLHQNQIHPLLVESVDIQPYWMFKDFLTMFMQQQSGRIWVSPSSSYGIVSSIPEERRLQEESPIQLRKAVKNSIEIEGMKKAHIRDAVALIEFLDWMEKEVPKGGVTEISAADKLESFRRKQNDYVGLSFATISASGPNAAVIHYKPSRDTDRPVTTDEIYLVDSGGQYRDGTTDVTRTIHFGTPTDKERECYTRVVKGAIALSTTKFPRLTKGNMIDTLARKSLWDVGLDYMHGTGHGVGAYLNVHEGPFSISFKENPKDPGLREGMFTSIEPGYYEDASFGIRLENVAQIVPVDTKYQFKQKQFLTFETITLVPVQKKLLNPTMLTEAEIDWLNTYHEQCRLVVGQVLEDQGKDSVLQWLMRETQPLG